MKSLNKYRVAKKLKNCDEIFRSVQSLSDSNYDLFELAQCFLDGYDPEKLRQMLTSKDIGIVSDGLFVLSETGSLAKNYSQELSILTRSDDADIKKVAIELFSFYGSMDRDQG